MTDLLDALQPSLYERLGHDKIVQLSSSFYRRVYADDDEWFRGMFRGVTQEHAIQNQYEFFVQRFGGPPLYSQRKGHPALRRRHAAFAVTRKAAARWLRYMHAAMDEVGISREERPEERRALWAFFQHVANFLRNAQDGDEAEVAGDVGAETEEEAGRGTCPGRAFRARL